MATISNTPRPGYVYDSTDAVWYPIGTGTHSHSEIASTIVDAKGDIIAASAADTPARLAVGNNGETLVADSSTSTGLRYNPSQAAGKNAIINGAFDIWQRGTSVAISSGGVATYASDRWFNTRTVAGQTISRQATGDTTNLPFIQYCARVQRDSGNTNTTQPIRINQLLETVNSIPFAGKTVTLSFYARAGANFSAVSSTLVAQLISGTGTDQNLLSGGYTGVAYPISSGVILTTTWQRFSVTGTVAATATELSVNIYHETVGTAGAADFFEITGVQLEAGSVATQFSRAGGTIQGELAACQRYYWRALASATYPNALFAPSGFTSSTTAFVANVQFPVEMRTQPTTLDFSTLRIQDSAGSVFAASALAVSDQSTTFMMGFSGVIAGATAGRWCKVIGNNSSAAYLGFGAEL